MLLLTRRCDVNVKFLAIVVIIITAVTYVIVMLLLLNVVVGVQSSTRFLLNDLLQIRVDGVVNNGRRCRCLAVALFVISMRQ